MRNTHPNTLVIFPRNRGDQFRQALEEAGFETQRLDGFNGQLTKMVLDAIIEAAGSIKVLVCNPRQRQALVRAGLSPKKWSEPFDPPAVVSLRDNARVETAVAKVSERMQELATSRASAPAGAPGERIDTV